MATIKLTTEVSADNPIAHDLHLVDGKLSFVEDEEAIAQHLRIRLQFFRGEWFADEREGVPWFEEILTKPSNLPLVRSILRKVVVDTPGISDVQDLSISLDRQTRTLSGEAKATLDTGEILRVGFDVPFVVRV
jgi:HSP20 family molecular chaperone IbpA